MSTGKATGRRRTSARLSRQLTRLGCAFALTVLLTGNVAAHQLDRDEQGTGPLVTPRANTPTVSGQWLSLKLATTAGHQILVYG